MKLRFEQLESRRLAASLAYSLQAPVGPLHVGQVVEVQVLGRAVYDAPTSPDGVFSWGASVEWNSQWLQLVDASLSSGYDWLPLVDPGEATWSTESIELGGLLDFDTLPLSGSDQVELASLTLRVIDGVTPGTLTGIQLSAGNRPSAILGHDEYVAADVSGAWVLWVVDTQPGHNADLPADVDGDTVVSPRDALLVINSFLRDGPGPATSGPHMLDVDGDGTQSTPDDVLAVFVALSDAEAA